MRTDARHHQQNDVEHGHSQRNSQYPAGSVSVPVRVGVHLLSVRAEDGPFKLGPGKIRVWECRPHEENRMRTFAFLLLVAASSFSLAQTIPVDSGRSHLTIHVEKSGLFAAFAHNHRIEAPIASGELDLQKRSVILAFAAREMKVMDDGISDSERSTIDQTMKSEKVLDATRFPEIRFTSTAITPQGDTHYLVRGDLALHGVTRPVEFPVAFEHDRYNGSLKLKQTDFGITPVTIAGGTVKVKDVIEIVFDIASSGKH